jgi:hypothetical protein
LDQFAKYKSHVLKGVVLPDGGMVVCFEFYDAKDCSPDDGYREMLKYLAETGPERNVFRLDRDWKKVWRIDQIDNTWGYEDSFVFVEFAKELVGWTGSGRMYRIDIENGAVDYRGWQKI